jgi:8-oxo-dGTP pyrophosphatase MutT (NUDIX family)
MSIKFSSNKGKFTTKRSETLFKGKWITLKHDSIVLPDGSEGIYDYVEKNDSVTIVAKVEDKFVLVEQYRYTVKKTMLEFPQGGIRDDEDPEIAARRELEEETGFVAEELRFLGRIDFQKGITSQGSYIYYASGSIKGNNNLEKEEQDLLVKMAKIEDIKKMIEDGKITDAPTIAAYSLYSVKFIESGKKKT